MSTTQHVTPPPAAEPYTTADGTTAPGRLTGYRWTVCALLFFATTINYMDRQVLGLLAPTRPFRAHDMVEVDKLVDVSSVETAYETVVLALNPSGAPEGVVRG